jgi:di/tricarboxylate transporter
VDTSDARLVSDDVRLVEALVPAGSDLVGATLATSEFRTRTGLNVVAISKSSGVQLQRLLEVELEVGDTLLVQGHLRDLERARQGREVLVLSEVGTPRFGRNGWVTLATLLGVLLAAATAPGVSLGALALAGVLVLVGTRVVRTDEAYRSIDWGVVFLVGGMLALGRAFQEHVLDPERTRDASDLLATWVAEGRLGPTALLAGVLGATVLLTQVLNNASTAVIMTPIALEVAAAAGLGPRPFLMAVVTGSSLGFLSPVAHQANAMILGPGGYRYRDFLRVGTPLAVLLLGVSLLLIPALWPFLPA